MKQSDYYFIGLVAVNIIFLLQLVEAFSITNVLAVVEHGTWFSYVSVVAALSTLLFILRNFFLGVIYLSGNSTDEKIKVLIHTMAAGTFLSIISFAVLVVSNVYIYYFFQTLGF